MSPKALVSMIFVMFFMTGWASAQDKRRPLFLDRRPGDDPSVIDITEIDSITGHQDYRTQQNIDIEVQFVGSTQFVSLSGGAGFHFTNIGGTALGKVMLRQWT